MKVSFPQIKHRSVFFTDDVTWWKSNKINVWRFGGMTLAGKTEENGQEHV